MTVRELMKALKDLPDDAEVFVTTGDRGSLEPHTVDEVHTGHVVDHPFALFVRTERGGSIRSHRRRRKPETLSLAARPPVVALTRKSSTCVF